MGTAAENFKNGKQNRAALPLVISIVYNRKGRGKAMPAQCELCIVISDQEEDILWSDDFCYVRNVADPCYPGFCRVIVRRHVSEMTDLSQKERERLMSVVFAVEKSLREIMRPDKINLASLGNAVPHLHWHVIPRWRGDRHFPQPVWGVPQREPASAPPAPDLRNLAALIAAALPRDEHEY